MNNELLPEPGWWKRNWPWALPVVGCLTFLVVLGVFIGSIFYGVTSMLDDSIPLEYAINKINTDPDIVKLMGFPIVKNGKVQGEFNWINDEKSAHMTVPISGTKENGTLFIKATAIGDTWTYQEIRVVIQDNNGVDLLDNDWE
jgi:hypothetical protein